MHSSFQELGRYPGEYDAVLALEAVTVCGDVNPGRRSLGRRSGVRRKSNCSHLCGQVVF